MNSLKNLFFLLILSAVAWGVYVTLNRPPEAAPPPPPGAPQTAPDVPRVEVAIPSAPTPGNQALTPTAGGQVPAGMAPPFAPPSVSSSSTASSPTASAADVRHDQASPTSVAPPFVSSGATTTPAYSAGTAPPFVPSTSPGPPPGAGAPDISTPSNPSSPPLPTIGAGSAPPKADATATAAAIGTPGAEKTAAANERITSLLTLARTKLDEGHIAEAHLLLSPLCREPGAPPELLRLLDQMAGVVIYSRQHLLEPPYQVQTGDTLERIADACHVPAILLARINGIRDSESLRPGRELKVVRGPFSAVIDLGKSELTLMLRDRYAGRFPVSFISPGRLEGSYTVLGKQGASASDSRGATAANSSAASYWIDLGNGLGIGRNREGPPTSLGSIGLGDRDIDDVYGILSVGSSVTIKGAAANVVSEKSIFPGMTR